MPGLPASDDALAGYAAARQAAGLRVRLSPLAAGRSHLIGLAYLRRAERGELADGPARMLFAIRAGRLDAVEAALGPCSPGVLIGRGGRDWRLEVA